MSVLVDTNLLIRLANVADPLYLTAKQAVTELHRRGDVLHITAQNMVEFRNAPTRLVAMHALGLTTIEAEAKAAGFEATFPLLPETSDVFPVWKTLVAALGVIGKQVHDARLVAVRHVRGVTHLLTFDTGHFARFAGYGSGLVVVDPATV